MNPSLVFRRLQDCGGTIRVDAGDLVLRGGEIPDELLGEAKACRDDLIAIAEGRYIAPPSEPVESLPVEQVTEARSALATLRSRGLRVGLSIADGSARIIIGPVAALTADDREYLGANREAVLTALITELPQDEFERSGLGLVVSAPDLGGRVQFRGDDCPPLDGVPSYTVGELRVLMRMSPDGQEIVAGLKAAFGHQAVVDVAAGDDRAVSTTPVTDTKLLTSKQRTDVESIPPTAVPRMLARLDNPGRELHAGLVADFEHAGLSRPTADRLALAWTAHEQKRWGQRAASSRRQEPQNAPSAGTTIGPVSRQRRGLSEVQV